MRDALWRTCGTSYCTVRSYAENFEFAMQNTRPEQKDNQGSLVCKESTCSPLRTLIWSSCQKQVRLQLKESLLLQHRCSTLQALSLFSSWTHGKNLRVDVLPRTLAQGAGPKRMRCCCVFTCSGAEGEGQTLERRVFFGRVL